MRIKIERPELGNRVSVPRTYFDGDGNDENYSSYLPADVQKIIGTVIFMYERKARVRWDLDGMCNDIIFQDLSIEPSLIASQVIEAVLPCSSSKRKGDDVDFIKEMNAKVCPLSILYTLSICYRYIQPKGS